MRKKIVENAQNTAYKLIVLWTYVKKFNIEQKNADTELYQRLRGYSAIRTFSISP